MVGDLTGKNMDAVKTILERSGCSQYVEMFQRKGYDSAAHLLSMGPNDLNELQKECGVLSGHMHRIRNLLEAMNYRAHVVDGEVQVHEESAAAAAATAAPSAAANSEGPGVSKPEQVPVLKQVHDTWAQAKLASYEFSTRCGYRALLDKKRSGGKRKIYRCSSVLGKKSKGADDNGEGEERIPCAHQLYWKKNKGTGEKWMLDTAKSQLGHTPFCNSEQKTTRMELVHDKEFIKHVSVEKQVTGSSAAKHSLGGESGRLDGSVHSRTARRAANDVMRYHDKDYKEDWSKLEGWKREYERKNPQSRCVFQDNPASRAKKMYGPILCLTCVLVCVWMLCSGPYVRY